MLAAGIKLGPYEIVAPIGAGAMGEVYRARDARLSRDVAIKVLPPGFASDPERLRRFEQEARAAGQLNHPNILAVFDVGNHEGTPYVVTELLEGGTLRERLAAALPQRRAIEYAIQIAHGLAAAHEHGITHRDLKPENLFVTNDGRVKILDFGLAKLTRTDGAALREYDSLAGTMTATGVILGTAGYMAPEQVRGKPADHRADLFAFGAILYEMLSGKRAFHGDSAVETLHAILREEPAELTAAAGGTGSAAATPVPPALERIVRHCLEKSPEQRFQAARDIAFNLEALSEMTMSGGTTALSGVPLRAQTRERAAWAVAIVALAVAGAALVIPRLLSRPAEGHAVRFSVLAPGNTSLHANPGDVAISPDGQMLAFATNDSSGVAHLWVRPIESLSARMLPGTESAYLPFWSPDSRSIGYFIEGKMKRVLATGGNPELICDAVSGRGGSWNRDGVILFAPTPSGAIYRVPASGGEPVAVTSLDSSRHETAHRFPCFLPDGKRFIYVALPPREHNFDVYAGTLGSGQVKLVTRAPGRPTPLPTGWMVLARNQTLMAQRFDWGRLALTGDPQPVGEAPGYTQYDGEPCASASDGGLLAYPSGALTNTRLEWRDRSGRPLGTVPMPPGRYEILSLSPDDKRVAVERRNSATSVDIWVADLSRGVATRLTFDASQCNSPVWSPDGTRIIFASNRAGSQDFYRRSSTGAGEDELLFHSSALFKVPIAITPDGKTLVFHQLDSKTAWDIWRLPLEGDPQPSPYVHSPFNEIPSAISPDGKWLAYASDESGRSEVYVVSFPNPTTKYQVSTAGFNPQNYGVAIGWSRGGSELLFGGADGATVMCADVQPGGGFETSAPRSLFKLPQGTLAVTSSADGQRFLATVPSTGGAPATLTVVMNWVAGLKH